MGDLSCVGCIGVVCTFLYFGERFVAFVAWGFVTLF